VLRREARSQALMAFTDAVTRLQRRIAHPERRKGPASEVLLEPRSRGFIAFGHELKRA
jgi:hypothetical protein